LPSEEVEDFSEGEKIFDFPFLMFRAACGRHKEGISAYS
jgi:hypothetical protein